MSKLKHFINRQYLLAIIMILTINTFGFIAHIYITNKNEGYAELINLSGRQRMLSQRIPLFISQIESETDSDIRKALTDEANTNIQLFEQSHNTLSGISADNRLKIEPEIIAYYDQSKLNSLVESFIEEAKFFSQNPEDHELLREFTTRAKTIVLTELDKAVKLFEARSEELNQLQFIVQIFVFIILIIAVGIIALVVLIPLRKKIISHEHKLAESIKKLEEEGTYKSMFLANMSHELRTPLNGILGVTALIKSRASDEELRQYLDIIDTSSSTLLGTIQNILDQTKIEMNQMEVESRAFNPERVLQDTFQIFLHYPQKQSVEIIKEVESLPKWITGDEQKLKQILNNLLSNAMKFTDKGFIKIAGRYADSHLELEIIDTGVGISEAKLKTIFEPFKQEDASTNRVYGGTGLGLAISKQMVEMLNGTIEITSVQGEGTTFHIKLPFPVADVQPVNTVEEDSENASLTKQFEGTVLITEDNDINYRVLAKMLEKIGLEHQHAKDGLESIEKVKQHDFDLILMDYHMPNLNGIDAIAAIKTLGKALPPIIMLTADISDSARKEAFDVGAEGFIEKPIVIKQLNQVIQQYLKNSSHQTHS